MPIPRRRLSEHSRRAVIDKLLREYFPQVETKPETPPEPNPHYQALIDGYQAYYKKASPCQQQNSAQPTVQPAGYARPYQQQNSAQPTVQPAGYASPYQQQNSAYCPHYQAQLPPLICSPLTMAPFHPTVITIVTAHPYPKHSDNPAEELPAPPTNPPPPPPPQPMWSERHERDMISWKLM
jgi:hypothetical protein